MDAITEYADACRQREFMGGFHAGTIQNDGTPFNLGTTESAIVEATLRGVEQGKSMLIHNPFPTTALPVAIIASYAYSEKPGIPGTDGLPMFVFPASSRGYLGEVDRFHFQTTARAEDNKTPLIPRYSIDALSEQTDDWGVYTAKDGFVFDAEAHDAPLGAIFVDLQKPEWSERVFDRIESFCEEHPEVPTIFYTNEMGPAAELTSERIDMGTLRVTNEMLAQAPHEDGAAPGESDLTTQERILSNGGVDVLQFPVTDTDFGSLIPEFIQLKNKCQNRDLAYVEVSRVFNRLTKQPFKPRYWTRTVGSNAFFDDVPGYIERIERRAENASSGGNLLFNYARKANEVQGYLNDKHVLQNTVLDAIQRAGETDDTSRFVVSNTAEKKALRLAATDSGYAIPGNVELVERQNVRPMPDTRYVFLYPPYRDDYVFEFPPSKQVAFIHNALWSNYVRKAAQDATENVTASYKTTSIGASGAVGDVDDHVFDIDTLESDIESYIRRTDFGGGGSSSSGGRSAGGSGGGDDYVFHLGNGDQRTFSEAGVVTVYDSAKAKITRKKAKNVSEGEEILLLDSVAGDLYDVLLESAHKRDAVREDEDLVENWRELLNAGMEREGMDYSDVVDTLQEHGSDIESWHSVRAWAEGRYIGPLDEGDCRRILHIFRPELEGELLEQLHEAVWQAMKHLRLLHRRIGRNVRRAVEAEFNPSTSAKFGGDVNESMIRNIARDIERQTVTRIDRTDDD
jgi:hypothetical protein